MPLHFTALRVGFALTLTAKVMVLCSITKGLTFNSNEYTEECSFMQKGLGEYSAI